MPTVNILSDFQLYAEHLVETHQVPAVSLAVWQNKQLHQAAAGILNRDTAVAATTDSVFQIGSIGKVMTASLVMQLVDAGRIDLDRPVKHYLRDFAIADSVASAAITVRQLLNHSSGIAGDFIPNDRHHSGNLIARYLDRCNRLPLVHPVGQFYSYSNAAYGILGRLIEVMTGGSWFDAIEERLFQALGMTHALCRPEDTLRYRAAIGHLPDPDAPEQWQLTHTPFSSSALAPAGTTLSMTAADLITFARAHMDGGLSQSGQRWLSKQAVAQMQQAQIALPCLSSVVTTHMGLGWGLSQINRSDQRYFGHLGGTIGQRSLLRIVPEQNLCFVALVNCDNDRIIQAISNTLLKSLAGIDLTEAKTQTPALKQSQLTPMVGHYSSIGDSYSVTLEGGQLTALHHNRLHNTTQVLQLRAFEPASFILHKKTGEACGKLVFLNPNTQGQYGYLYSGGRMHPRTANCQINAENT